MTERFAIFARLAEFLDLDFKEQLAYHHSSFLRLDQAPS